MKYFKIVQNDKIIGVVTSNNFRVFQTRHNFLLISDENKGQFVEYDNKLYRDTWMVPVVNQIVIYEKAKISEISEVSYNEYAQIIKEGTEEIPEVPEENLVKVIEIGNEDNNIDAVKQLKLAALSNACHQAIENGFDVESEHYSLSAYDQLNIATLSSLIANGKTEVLYHADGKPVEYYSASRFKLIAEMAAYHIWYHTTYYNTLKAYVNSLENEKDILAIQYGDEIPEEYQTAILKNL